MGNKLGVYFCDCGTAITDKIDSAKIEAGLAAAGESVHFRRHELLCSEEGKQFLENDLRENGVERAVICACSPRDHEQTFMRCMGKAGCNPYLMQMVNVREQIAWVCEDRDQATAKAMRAVKAAIGRVKLHQPLEKKEIDICVDALIIGGGPAGMRAALTIAESGRKAILVEKEPVLGGMPVRYEDTFPRMECAPCMLEPMMAEILHGEHAEHIEILTMAEVVETVGSYGNFTVTIHQRPRYVDAQKCIGCGECTAPCPAESPNPFNFGMGSKKAMSFPFAGALPNLTFLDESVCLRFAKNEPCKICQEACPVEGAVNFKDAPRTMQRTVGAIILAVGAQLYDCSNLPQLGFGKLPEVYTSAQFERLISSTGPTSGEIKTQAGEVPRSIAIVHCVGSLDSEHKSYCSGVCCQVAFKFNHLIGKRVPEAKIVHYFKELVTPGKEEFELRREAEHSANTTMIRYQQIRDLEVVSEQGRTAIRHKGGIARPVDMVVLCPALIGPEDAAKLCTMLETNVDGAGFLEELHGRMNSAQSKIKGIYLAGTCQAPGDIQKAMNQGMAAAGYVLSGLVPGRKLEISPVRAIVDEERCSGCRVCGSICPYKAINFDTEKKVSRVNEVLCQGCGTCVAACPAGSIWGNHFTNDEIFAEIEGMLK
jgi:heterodisulfide reductase subunit A